MNESVTRNQQLTGRTAVMNLDYKIAAILCYTPVLLIDIIAPIVWLKTEPKSNKELRFHAIQGLLISIITIALAVINSTVMTMLSVVLGFFAFRLLSFGSSLITLAFLAVSLYGIYCVWNGKEFRLPYLSEIADKNA